MSFLKKLFGSKPTKPKAPTVVESIMYDGYKIDTTPMNEGGQFRLCALITKEVDGITKTHNLIRADVLASKEQASEEAIRKAKQVIDEQGERILG